MTTKNSYSTSTKICHDVKKFVMASKHVMASKTRHGRQKIRHDVQNVCHDVKNTS